MIGGVIGYSYIDNYFCSSHAFTNHVYSLPRIWDAENGKILYEISDYASNYSQYERKKIGVIDARFSPDSRFFSVRYTRADIDLIDTTNFTTLPAQGDVAYNSDVRYMVTGRNGLPTLVDLTTMEEIQKYEIQAAMTACAFSPDNQELYIVDSNRTLYIFDAQLPTRIARWELYE
ncbi:MAG: hypothetical protein AB1656_27345 [Candidatus Omnitrophota bacterium]